MNFKKLQNEKGLFIFLSISSLVETLLYGLIVPLLPYYVDFLEVSTSQIGFIVGAYSLALLLGSFVVGIACERFGDRKVLLSGLSLLAISTYLFSTVNNIGLLVAVRMFQGLAGAAIWVSCLSVATNLFKDQGKGKILGILMGITGIGTIIGPVIGGVLFDLWGYRSPFYFSMSLMIIALIGLLFFNFPIQEKEKSQENSFSIRKILSNKEVLLILSIIVSASFGFGLLEPLLSLHLNSVFNLDSQNIGFVFGFMGLMFALMQPLIGNFSDKIGYWKIILIGLFATIIFVPFIAIAGSLALLLGIIFIYAVTESCMLVPCLPRLTQIFMENKNNSHGKIFALVNAIYSLGLLLGPSVGGLVAQYFSFLGALLVYIGLLLVIFFFSISYIRKK